MDKEQIKAAIEKYHQANYYNLFPAGKVQEWVIDAVLQNVVQPLEEEIKMLKATAPGPGRKKVEIIN